MYRRGLRKIVIISNTAYLLQMPVATLSVDNIVDVVSICELIEHAPDGPRPAEIVRRSFDRGDLTGGEEFVVDRGDVGGEQGEVMGEDVAAAVAAEVPVSVGSQVHWGGLVECLGLHFDAQLVCFYEHVCYHDIKITWKPCIISEHVRIRLRKSIDTRL